MENPFLISGYINPDYFCDREEETNRVISARKTDEILPLLPLEDWGKQG